MYLGKVAYDIHALVGARRQPYVDHKLDVDHRNFLPYFYNLELSEKNGCIHDFDYI